MSLKHFFTLTLAAALAISMGCSQGDGDVEVDKDAGAAKIGSAGAQSPGVRAADLTTPVRLKAGGEFIDTEVGHAAPFLADMNKDGKRDLLVGQFGGGKLKVCLNVGTDPNPDYEAPVYFIAGGEIASVETG